MSGFTALFHGNEGKDQQHQAWGDLGKLFGTATDSANTLGTTGTANKDSAASYFQKLLSGNRQETEAAVSPAANAAVAGADAAKGEQSTMGTARTGGTVAGNQQVDDKVRAQVDSLIGGAKPQAAAALGTLGNEDIDNMMKALGLGTSAATNLAGQTGLQHRYAAKAASDEAGGLSDILFSVLTGA